jgi:FtsZ-binding cell division protein ZapB
LKKNVKTYALVILILFMFVAIFDNLRISDVAEELQGENDMLVERVASLKKESEKNQNTTVTLENENKRLKDELSGLEHEIEALKTSVDSQDLFDAIEVVEAYKGTKTFDEAIGFILLRNGLGYSKGPEGKCPCEISFNGRLFEWLPNAVQELTKFRVEGDTIYLTYKTSNDIKYNYQFILSKGEDFDQIGKWRIKSITLDYD